MTQNAFISNRLLPVPSDQPTFVKTTPVHYTAPTPSRSTWLQPVEDRISQGMLLGLITVTLPAAAYALLQGYHLIGGDTLHHAVHTFLP